jgi:hypothetical protein
VQFNEGDAVRNILRERDGVFVRFITEVLAAVDYGGGPEPTSVKHLGLTARQQRVADRKAKLAAAREARAALQESERLQKASVKFAATPVEVLKRTDPGALVLLAEYCKAYGYRIEISCAPSHFEKTAAGISANTCLTEVDAVDYIKICTEASLGAKYDLMFPEGLSEDLVSRLGVLLWGEHNGQQVRGFRAKTGEAQINSRQLIEWLMKEHNFLPKKCR